MPVKERSTEYSWSAFGNKGPLLEEVKENDLCCVCVLKVHLHTFHPTFFKSRYIHGRHFKCRWRISFEVEDKSLEGGT